MCLSVLGCICKVGRMCLFWLYFQSVEDVCVLIVFSACGGYVLSVLVVFTGCGGCV